MKKQIAAILAVFLLCGGITGCAASAPLSRNSAGAAQSAPGYGGETAIAEEPEEEDIAYDAEMPAAYDYDEAEPEMEQALTGGATPVVPGGDVVENVSAEQRKIVYTVDLSLQTTAFDDAVAQLPKMTEEIGGLIQDSYIEGTNMNQKYYARTANFTVRVPSEKLDAYIASLGEAFHIVSQRKHSSDITRDYYDIKARLESLRIQQERLTSMLEDATELQYMLEVERELADVLYQIESITSTMNRMDSSVNLSTVTVYLQEVSAVDENQPVVEPITFGERISQTFGDSAQGFVRFCQNALLFLIALIPFLPVIIVIVIIILIIRRVLRSRRTKREQPRNTLYVSPSAPPPGFPEKTTEEPDQPDSES